MSLSFKTAGRLLAAVVTIALASSAHAATYRWSFNDLTFHDGAKGYGSFYSNGTTIFNWDITTFWDPDVPGFPEMVSPYHYTTATSSLEPGSTFRLLRSDTPVQGNYLELSFSQALNRAGTVHGGALERTESFGGSIASHSGVFNATSDRRAIRFPRQRPSPGEDDRTSSREGLDSGDAALFSGEEVMVATPVPEPQTYAMAMLGLLLISAAVRHKKK